MMIFSDLLKLLTTHTTEIAALFGVAGVCLLLVPIRAAARKIQAQAQAIASLQFETGENARARLALYDLIDSLNERCAQLHERQLKQGRQTLSEPDTRRFSAAIRMVKRGVGDVQSLHDLGLSNGEAELLMRLHNGRSARPAGAGKPALAGQAKALVQLLRA